MLWRRQTTLWVYTMCLFFHIQRDEFYSWLATKASVKCVVLRAVKRRLSVVRVFSFSGVFCRTTRKRKPAVYSLKERHDSHRPTCQRVYGVSYILLLISQWSATQGAWYILTGLAAGPFSASISQSNEPHAFSGSLPPLFVIIRLLTNLLKVGYDDDDDQDKLPVHSVYSVVVFSVVRPTEATRCTD